MYQSGSLMLQHRHPSSWCSPFQLRYAWHQSKLCLLNFGSVLMVFGSAACLNQKVSMFFLVKPTFPRSLGEYTLWPYMGIQVVVWVLKVEPLVRRKKKHPLTCFTQHWNSFLQQEKRQALIHPRYLRHLEVAPHWLCVEGCAIDEWGHRWLLPNSLWQFLSGLEG